MKEHPLIHYHDMGLPVIPVIGKRTFVTNWSRFCHELPTRQQAETWAKWCPYPRYGVALCAGPASGVDALDIDSDSNDILNICPRSPLERRGARGSIRIFQHNSKIIKRERDRDNLIPGGKRTEGVQLLSAGNYFVLPPSIHPDTNNPYVWVGEYCLENFSILDLPSVSQKELDEVCVYISRFPLTGAGGNPILSASNGRNNKLTAVCYAIIKSHSYKTDVEIAEELLAFDQTRHNPPYFSDPKEMYYRRGASPFLRALAFVTGTRGRLRRKGDL